MKLEEAKSLYHGEWIAFKSIAAGDNPEGDVLYHHPDRHLFDMELLKLGLTDVYIPFAGPLVNEGFSVLF